MTGLQFFGLSSLAFLRAGFARLPSRPVGELTDLNAYMLRDINLTAQQRAAFTHKSRDVLSPAYRYRLP